MLPCYFAVSNNNTNQNYTALQISRKMTSDQPDRVWSIQLKIRWTDQIFGGIEISVKKKNRRNILIEKSLTGSWVCQRGPVWSGRNFEEKKVFQLLKRSLATQWHSNVLALMFTYAYARATSRHKLLSAVSISRAVLLILISAALCYLFILLLTTPPISTYFHSLRLWIEKPL